MSAPRCPAGDLCEFQSLALPPEGSMDSRHFCLRCGNQKHAMCGPQFDHMLDKEEQYKDILDVIAPKKEGNGNRPVPKPAGEKGPQLEICLHCVNQIRSSTPAAAAAPPSTPPDSTEPMVVDITTETEATTSTNTTKSAPAEAPTMVNWLRTQGSNKKSIAKIRDGKVPHKKSSKSRAGKTTYSVAEKLKMVIIWENTKNGTGRKSALAKKWNVNEKTVRIWLKMKAKLEEQVNAGKGAKKTLFVDPLQRIVLGLMQFYEANKRMPRDLKLPMTGNVISVQALKIKNRLLKLHEENKLRKPLTKEELDAFKEFNASKSWASSKAIELGLKSVALHGEAADVDVEAISDEINALREKMRTYHPDNIYNMDETGLMYKCLPNRSYVKKDEVKSARGTKMMKLKDRVTVYVCSNASGTDFFPLSVIGKSATPHCFRGFTPKLTYYNQKKAWSDTATFKKWWNDFLAHIRLKTNDRVLLILDNCGPHCGKSAEFMNDPQVEVVMLPPNCTSMFQPMDSGVIAMIKKNYRFLLLSKYIDMFETRQQLRQDAIELNMRRGTKGLAQGYTPHVRDAIDLLKEVQDKVTGESLFNCWVKSTLLNKPTITNTATTATTPTAATEPAPSTASAPDAAPVEDNTAASSSSTAANTAENTNVDGPTTAAADEATAENNTAASSSSTAANTAENTNVDAPTTAAADEATAENNTAASSSSTAANTAEDTNVVALVTATADEATAENNTAASSSSTAANTAENTNVDAPTTAAADVANATNTADATVVAATTTTADAPVSNAIAAAWNVIDIKIADGKQQQDSTNAVDIHNKVSELAEMVLNSKKGADNSDPKSDENDVELILDEFAVTIKEHTGSGDSGDIDRMVEGWVELEDTELVQDEIREEVEQMLESAFVDDSEIVNEDAEKDSDEEDDDVEMQEGDLTPVTTDIIDELAADMKAIVGKLMKLDCDGEYDRVSSHLTDGVSLLRRAQSKHERNRVAKKQSKAPRQGCLDPFFRSKK